MTKVSGSVAYDDGSPIPADQIQLRFDSLEEPIDAKTHPRPGMATTGPDGTFSVVTTNKYGDGLIRGKHKVKVSATTASGEPLVPVIYNGMDSPLEVDSADAPFEIRVPRP